MIVTTCVGARYQHVSVLESRHAFSSINDI